jgi:hypothetical protein
MSENQGVFPFFSERSNLRILPTGHSGAGVKKGQRPFANHRGWRRIGTEELYGTRVNRRALAGTLLWKAN